MTGVITVTTTVLWPNGQRAEVSLEVPPRSGDTLIADGVTLNDAEVEHVRAVIEAATDSMRKIVGDL